MREVTNLGYSALTGSAVYLPHTISVEWGMNGEWGTAPCLITPILGCRREQGEQRKGERSKYHTEPESGRREREVQNREVVNRV